MPETAENTQTLAAFRENPAELLEQLKASHHPITLTSDGDPIAILQNPAEYGRLRDLAAEASAHEGIRQGLEDVAAGRTRPLQEVFDELRAKYAVPR
jgi:PHD/YefM family antitoxin component YafN of YafNO toxin-antitoxin module